MWQLAAGIVCVVMAIILFTTDSTRKERDTYRRPLGERTASGIVDVYHHLAQLPWWRVKFCILFTYSVMWDIGSAAGKVLIKVIAGLLRHLLILLKLIVTKTRSAIQHLKTQIRKRKEMKTKIRLHERQSEKQISQKGQTTLSDETIQQIQEHGLLQHIKGN
jgi:hypothetical protein